MLAPDKSGTFARRIPALGILINLFLAVLKLTCGILAHASALVSDAIHSSADVLSNVIVLFGIRFSSKEADREHPYGHDRFECIASLLLSVILTVTALGIGYNGICSILDRSYKNASVPGVLALWVSGISILLKVLLFLIGIAGAKKIHSTALRADAVHQLSDALASSATLIGILIARLGFPVFDPIASVLITLFILKTAIEIFLDSVHRLTDRAADEETVSLLYETVRACPGVDSVKSLLTRLYGASVFAECVIGVSDSLSLSDISSLKKSIQNEITQRLPEVKRCVIEVESSETVEPLCVRTDPRDSSQR